MVKSAEEKAASKAKAAALLDDIFQKIARLGAIHPQFQHAVSP